jgi:hypothetical protein
MEINLLWKCRRRAVRGWQQVDQKLRRFPLRLLDLRRAGSVWKLPQINTPANTTNTDTTAAETRIESMGVAISS